MVSKVRNVRLGVFSGGGCHHPNQIKRTEVEQIVRSEMSQYSQLVKMYFELVVKLEEVSQNHFKMRLEFSRSEIM